MEFMPLTKHTRRTKCFQATIITAVGTTIGLFKSILKLNNFISIPVTYRQTKILFSSNHRWYVSEINRCTLMKLI